MNLKGLTDEQIKKVIEYVTSEEKVNFWGNNYNIKPALVDEIQGDGMQLVYIIPLSTRPNYYILRIDSSIDIEDADKEIYYENYGGKMPWDEMACLMIEEQYDNIAYYTEDEDGLYYSPDDDRRLRGHFEYHFPMLDDSNGYAYGTIEDCRSELGF